MEAATVRSSAFLQGLRPESRLLDPDGKPCTVTGVSPVFTDRECFRITLTDGAEFVADGSHLWTVWDEKKYEYRKIRTLTTAEIAQTFRSPNGIRPTTGEHKTRSRYAIDNCKPLKLPEAVLTVGPYTLGAWLGDGNSASNQITTHADDAQEMANYIRSEGLPCLVRKMAWTKGNCVNILIDRVVKSTEYCIRGHEFAKVGLYRFLKRGKAAEKCYECIRERWKLVAYGTPRTPVSPRRRGLYSRLLDLGLINNKHIPAYYLRASETQRLALLQGLMDTDGSITKSGRCEFSTNSTRLRDDVYELLVSLGLKPSVYVRTPSTGSLGAIAAERRKALPDGDPDKIKQTTVVYRLSFLAYDDIPVFRLKRKVARIPSTEGRRTSETKRRRICKVEPIASRPVRCIEVDTPSHLFLAGRAMVPTHNTEAGSCWLGYIMHHAPGPAMAVMPTVEMAKRNSKQRIDPLIEETEVLRNLVQSPRSRDSGNTILSKEFPGGILVMTGANSAVGLRSFAARYLFLDEIDAYPLDVDGEGDPITLAIARTRTFSRRKIFLTSTPLEEGTSRIKAAFEASDQRHYFVPCPHCDHYQVLIFDRIRWINNNPDTAAYICEACEGRIENYHKTTMLERGEWRPTADGDGKTAGFHLPSYYSPVGWFSFADAAKMYQTANKNSDQSMLRVFTNTVDAQTWRQKGEAPDWKRLYDRAQAENLPYDRKVPMRGLFLTAGADVQKDRIEVQVVAWGRGKESWVIDYEVLAGDTSRPEVWDKLSELVNRTYTHESGTDLPLVRLAIDSGAETQTVYSWVRKQGPGRVMAVRGVDHAIAIVGIPGAVDITWAGKRARRAAKVWPINVSALKGELYGWLRLESPVHAGDPFPPGYCHFTPGLGDEFFKQLVAEHLVTKLVKGYQRQEWQKLRDRNEALDTRNYARGAASQFGIDRFTERDWQFLEEPLRLAREQADAANNPVTQPVSAQPVPQAPVKPREDRSASQGWIPKRKGWFD
jgi:phage terminase large subunit GpA-like protein